MYRAESVACVTSVALRCTASNAENSAPAYLNVSAPWVGTLETTLESTLERAPVSTLDSTLESTP